MDATLDPLDASPENVPSAVVTLAVATGITDALEFTVLSAVVSAPDASAAVDADPLNVLSAVAMLAVATGLTDALLVTVLASVLSAPVAMGLTDALAVTVLSAVVRLPATVAPLAAEPPTYSPSGFVPKADVPRLNQATLANSRTGVQIPTIARALRHGGPQPPRISPRPFARCR